MWVKTNGNTKNLIYIPQNAVKNQLDSLLEREM